MRLSCRRVSLLVLNFLSLSLAPAFQQQPEGPAEDDNSQIGALPLPILYYTPETGLAGGAAVLMFHRPDTSNHGARPSSVILDLIYTQKKQIIVESNPDLYLFGGDYRVSGWIKYSKYPQKFFGIGNTTPDSLEEGYTSRTFLLQFDAVRRISERIGAGISFSYESRSISDVKPNGLLEPGTLPGSRGGTTLGLGVVVQWDSRDNIFTPTNGRYYQFQFLSYSPKLGSDFDFSQMSLDLRQYWLFTGSSVLAGQFLTKIVSGTAPFHKLAELGGASTMRGYYGGRYRDNKLLAGQLEYRFPVYWRFGGAVFAGAGDVAPTVTRFRVNEVKLSYGLGLRYLFDPREGVSIRLDVGFGKNTSGMYITANEAF